jgi:hypothetical protein
LDQPQHSHTYLGQGAVLALPGVETMSSEKFIDTQLLRARAQVIEAEHLIAVLVNNLGRGVNSETSNAYLKYVQQYGIPTTKEDNGPTTNTERAREP